MTTALIPSSPMTQREFGVIFAKLAMQLRATDVDEATIRSYYEVLGGHPLEAVKAAGDAFGREAGRRWLPTTGEWTQAIQEALTATLRDSLSARRDPWRVECGDCDDTGWIQGLVCDGGGDRWPEQVEKEARGAQTLEFRGNKRLVGYRAVSRETDAPRASTCGRGRPHAPHSYTQACPCRPTNRTYLRNMKFGKGD